MISSSNTQKCTVKNAPDTRISYISYRKISLMQSSYTPSILLSPQSPMLKGIDCSIFDSKTPLVYNSHRYMLVGVLELFRPNEAKTRRELIDPALKKAGWDVNNPDQVRIEIPVEQSVQPQVVRNELTGPYVQLQMKY